MVCFDSVDVIGGVGSKPDILYECIDATVWKKVSKEDRKRL